MQYMKFEPNRLFDGQRKVLSFYADAEDQGRQASRAECAEELGYAFPSAVSKHIDALARKDMIIVDELKKRNVELTEKGWLALGRSPASKGVPVIGSIAAGTPILASENHDKYLDDIRTQPGQFALLVQGDSMVEAGINDGDYAIIEHGGTVKNGQIGAVVVAGDATLKTVLYQGRKLVLQPANHKYEDMVFNKSEPDIAIVGPLVSIYRTY